MIDVVIPCAGCGRRMKSYGPKSLIQVGHESILERQVRILRQYFHGQIIIVTGFLKEKIEKKFANFTLINNENYAYNNVAHSIKLGLERVNTKNCLIVYGDLIFPENIFEFNFRRPCVWVNQSMRKDEVGLNVIEDKVSCFAYGLTLKWSQIVYLNREQIDFFKRNTRPNYFGFEVLNNMINQGANFTIIEHPLIYEVDTSKNLKEINIAALN